MNTFRHIPQNIEAEQAVLGSILISSQCIEDVIAVLEPKDFYRSAHRDIFSGMLILYHENIDIDHLTLIERLDKTKKLEKVGGIAFITSLANTVPTAVNVKQYADIVKEKSVLRDIIRSTENIASIAYDDSYKLDEIADKAQSLILSATNYKKHEVSGIEKISMEALMQIEDIFNHKGELMGLPTGFKDLDKLFTGLKKSDFIILAARPSMGKTAFALNIASYLALKKNIPVAFFSLEMSAVQLMHRIYASCAVVDANKLRTGDLSEDELFQITGCAAKVATSPLIIDDEVNFNILELRSKVRQLKKEKDIQLVIIDYLQLLEGTKKDSRCQEISEISRFLKLLAKELDITIIALSQLSRSVENRQNKQPQLSDLRESGSLEQDADIVMFLYREDYYNPQTERQNITDVIVAKHRNGAVDTIPLFFHKQFLRFADLIKNQGEI